MNARRTVQIISGVLWVSFVLFYLAAKVHFFSTYDPTSIGRYIQEHRFYWAGMGITAFLIWLVAKVFPNQKE